MTRPLEDVLHDLRAAFTATGNVRAAEQTFGMLLAAAAASEVMKAMERGDDDATRFHTDLLNHCLESHEIPDFHLEA
ncbi:MAG TPA: hypothetical protein VF821_21285 [Lentzea sp.]